MNCSQNIKASLLALVGSLSIFPAAAQLHESINVDGRYVPDVIRVERINAFPKALKPTLSTSPLNYESRGIAASFTPSLMTIPATGWGADRYISSQRGYIELGAGSWLNSTLSAGYRFIDNSSTLFGVRLQHNSVSMWKPEMSVATSDVKHYRYDESVALYASHVIKGYGRLDAALDYHIGYFNYFGLGGLPGDLSSPKVDPPNQTINDVALRLDWRSLLTPSSSLEWNVSARMRHFAYRALPMPYHSSNREKGGRETNIGLDGGVCLPWDNGSSIGIDGNFDLTLLSEIDLGKYAMATLMPYYRFSKGLLDIRLGADIDFAYHAGEEGDRYPFIHIAPDLRFGVQTGQVGVYLDILGGTTPTTLARLHQLDYYTMPTLVTTRPTFTPLDATFGINLGPFSGFSMGLKARYVSAKNIPLGGWYTTWLNYGMQPIDGLTPSVPVGSSVEYCDYNEGINLHGYSVSGCLAYEFGDVFSISAEGSYQPQDGKKGFFNGYDRARVTAAANVCVRPVKPLKIGAGFDFRGKRNIYTTSFFLPLSSSSLVINGETTRLHSYELPDLTLLNLYGSWDFSKDFTLWLQADNILNRHDAVLPLQPSQGIVFMAGLKWLF